MIATIVEFLLATAEFLIVYPALLRFYLQVMRVPPRNQISDFVAVMTNFAVKPLRRLIPGFNGWDIASLFWAWLAEMLLLLLKIAFVAGMLSETHIVLASIPLLALFKLVVFSIQLLVFVIVVQAIMSWFAPFNPLKPVFDALLRPFLAPLQRVIKPTGGFDLSSLVLLIICQLLLRLLGNISSM